MNRLLRRNLTFVAAAGAALAAPALVSPPREIVRADRPLTPIACAMDALVVAGHLAPGMIGGGGSSGGPPASFVAASANGAGASAAMPAGWAAGDLLILVATAYKSGTTSAGHDTPAGWTLLDSFTTPFGGDYQSRTRVFYRIAQSGDSTVTLAVAGGETAYNSYMLAYRGANAGSPFEAVATLGGQPSAATIPYAEITTLGVNRVVLQIIASWTTGSVTSAPGASWTERFDSGNSIGLAADERTFTAAGAVPAGNQSRSGSFQWGRMAFAIRPA